MRRITFLASTSILRLAVWPAAFALLVGCTPMTGSLTPEGFSHSTYEYQIGNTMDGTSLLGDDWILDSAYESNGTLKPKDGDNYKTKISFDTNGDGTFETVETTLVYDLRYVHRVHSGVIWLRNVPISSTLRDKELRVLMQEYVDGVAGAGYELVNVGNQVGMVERRYAADITRRGSGTVGGTESFATEFGVANVDQLQVDKTARQTRVMVVIARPGFEYKLRRRQNEPVKVPVLFVAGYSSLPDDFEKGLGDFESLLNRVRFRGQTGYTVNWEGSETPAEKPTAAETDAKQEPASEAQAATPEASPTETAAPTETKTP